MRFIRGKHIKSGRCALKGGKMEVVIFALGIIAGLLIAAARNGGERAPAEPKEREMPPELMKQYEELFGYDGK